VPEVRNELNLTVLQLLDEHGHIEVYGNQVAKVEGFYLFLHTMGTGFEYLVSAADPTSIPRDYEVCPTSIPITLSGIRRLGYPSTRFSTLLWVELNQKAWSLHFGPLLPLRGVIESGRVGLHNTDYYFKWRGQDYVYHPGYYSAESANFPEDPPLVVAYEFLELEPSTLNYLCSRLEATDMAEAALLQSWRLPQELAVRAAARKAEEKLIKEETDMPVNETVVRFANASLVEALGMLRVGFELETQMTEGRVYEDGGGSSFNEREFDNYCYDRADTDSRDVYALENYVGGIQDWRDEGGDMKELAKMPMEDLEEKFDFRRSRIQERMEADNRESTDRSNFYSDDEDEVDFNLGHLVTSCDDGSVSGWEFKASRPLKISEFKTAVDRVFRLDHEIDIACSFHIHLSIPGVKHTYGYLLQGDMTRYILDNWSLLPESVQQRKKQMSYYKAQLSRDKYTAAAYHGHFGTWEFRIFGNVQNTKEGVACLLMAVRALQYAYKQKIKRTAERVNQAILDTYIDEGSAYRALQVLKQERKKEVRILRVGEGLPTSRRAV